MLRLGLKAKNYAFGPYSTFVDHDLEYLYFEFYNSLSRMGHWVSYRCSVLMLFISANAKAVISPCSFPTSVHGN